MFITQFTTREQQIKEFRESKMCGTDKRSNPSLSFAKNLSSDSIINLDHGDPTMFKVYWERMGDKCSITITGWQSLSYFSNTSNICWFLEPEFENEVRRIHEVVGNAVVDDYHIVVGNGSSQLFQAALFALSPANAPQPINVVSAAPYYSSYPALTQYLKSGLYKWAGDACAFDKEEPYIELVTSPNNPDGFIREAVVNCGEFGKLVHDLAYYWPQYTAITAPAGHDLMLFTVSKCTGHAGTRIGWALVKDREVAMKMTKFIELNTIGVSKDSQLRAAKILQVLSNCCEHARLRETENFFDYFRGQMTERWDRLRAVVKGSNLFSLPEYPVEFCNFFGDFVEAQPAFAWLKCREDIEDCESFLRNHKIITRSGRKFGVDSNIVGNAAIEDRHIVVGVGSSQLLSAVLYALCPEDTPEPISVVSAVPYYSPYPPLVDLLQSRLYKWAGDANTFNGEKPYIEIVCSPNNPDGLIKQAVVNKIGGKEIHDLAYYWPQYTAITAPADHDIMLFTASKVTGHAGSRIGWALVRDKEVAKKMVKYSSITSIGVSKDAQIRIARILEFISKSCSSNNNTIENIFDFGRRRMTERWDQLREAIEGDAIGNLRTPEFSERFCNFFKEPVRARPAFAWIESRADAIEDLEAFLRKQRILTRHGECFGSGPRFARASMVGDDPSFKLFIERLYGILPHSKPGSNVDYSILVFLRIVEFGYMD